MKIAVYPGTFDPPTKGHEDIVLRTLQIFDRLIIAVGDNSAKNVLFSLEERLNLWKGIFSNNPKISIVSFNCLTIDFVAKQGACAIVRGLRAISDYEYELQIASTNQELNPNIDTIFFTARSRHMFVSSTIVKEIACFGGDISNKVSPNVHSALLKKFK